MTSAVNAKFIAEFPGPTPPSTLNDIAAAMERVIEALIPPRTVIFADLTAAVVSANFTGGVGDSGTPYHGWGLCDGNSGRPNIANRFIRANNAGSTDESGGSDTMAHDHDIPAHGHSDSFTSAAHTLTVSEMPAHSHAIANPGGVGTSVTTSYTQRADPVNNNKNTTSQGGGGSHAHGLTGGVTDAGSDTSGAASNDDNKPAYHSLVALMRI